MSLARSRADLSVACTISLRSSAMRRVSATWSRGTRARSWRAPGLPSDDFSSSSSNSLSVTASTSPKHGEFGLLSPPVQDPFDGPGRVDAEHLGDLVLAVSVDGEGDHRGGALVQAAQGVEYPDVAGRDHGRVTR